MKGKILAVGKKLKSKFPTSTEDKERLKRACFTALGALQTTLNIVEQVAGNAGTPGLQSGIKGLILVLDVVQKISQNAQDVEQLGQRINGLMMLLQNAKDHGMLSETILARIDHLSTKWSSVADEVQKMAARNLFERTIHYSDDVQSISGHVKTITWSIESFTVESMLAIEFTLDEQSYAVHRIEVKLDNVAQKVDTGFQLLNAKLDVKDGHPPHTVFAQFDYKIRTRCLKGTRSGILEEANKWIYVKHWQAGEAVLVEATTQNLPVFWINGSAGTGKTTIAYTIAEDCRKRGILGASFFCSRDNAECSNTKLIFPTIAYQLGLFSPPFQAEVTRALKANPDIGYSGASYQLEELIVKPLRAVGKSFPLCVIVLDALDECKDSEATSVILSSLSRYIDELSPLKIFVTSRPERNITQAFSNHLSPATRRLILHEVELEVVQDDIERYLVANLGRVREFYRLDNSWPSVEDIHALALLSVGLFIFASTSVKFIEDKKYCNPRRQLANLLSNTTEAVKSSSSPHHHLDELYMEVLNRAFPDLSLTLAGQLKMVLGTIILLRDPLSPVALEQLLNLTEGTVRETLVCLHSVVIVPDDDDQVIRLHHPSFFDFMTSLTRCVNPKLVVNGRTQHTLLARECLRIMKDLKRDICGIKNPSVLNNEVDDLQIRISRYISPQLQYACRHWAFHLTNGMISDVLLELLKEFCSKYLLYWVEACGLLGELRSTLLALDSAQKALVHVAKDMTYVMALLHDCERFTREFFSVISTSPLQVYHSALLLTPEETLIRRTYQQELKLPMKIYNASGKVWDLCMRTMDGHFEVSSVAFSWDGTRIVSGSEDKTIRLWDAVSGKHLSTLEGHSGWVRSVAFSTDGTRVVSGASDKTIRLWDAISGTHLNTLEGHSDWVRSVAFSPDGTRIVSASDDKTIRLWDAGNGTQLFILEGHSDKVRSVAFSPDGTRLVSGSEDRSVRLWDAVRGLHLSSLEGHSESVNVVAFSPDGTRVASGSRDNTIILWDAVTGSPLNMLEGHFDYIRSVNFSQDSTRIVSGSDDKTIRLWDAVTGTLLKTLKGHSYHVHSVAFSPDGTRIVSGSRDKTVRLWDAARGAHITPGHLDQLGTAGVASGPNDHAIDVTHSSTLDRHSNLIYSLAFSPDGTRIVSGSRDKTVRLWDAIHGTLLDTLIGHSGYVNSVAFSWDGTCVVSGSDDKTIRVWSVNNGTLLTTLKGHTGHVRSVAFSPNGTSIVSGSDHHTVRLWDVITGTHVNTLKGHSGPVTSVSFSPDGAFITSESRDNTLRLWDARSGAHLDTMESYLNPAISVANTLTLARYSFPPSDAAYFASATPGVSLNDGWVCSLQRRLCWIPVSCRPDSSERLICSGSRIAIGTRDGRVIILDLAGMDSYLNDI